MSCLFAAEGAAWKFALTEKGVLSLAAVGRTEKLDFGELPEDCPYAIRELARRGPDVDEPGERPA